MTFQIISNRAWLEHLTRKKITWKPRKSFVFNPSVWFEKLCKTGSLHFYNASCHNLYHFKVAVSWLNLSLTKTLNPAPLPLTFYFSLCRLYHICVVRKYRDIGFILWMCTCKQAPTAGSSGFVPIASSLVHKGLGYVDVHHGTDSRLGCDSPA